MKAFLVKEDYLINEIDISKIKNGLKGDSDIKDFLKKDRTIGFIDALRLVSKITKFPREKRMNIEKFHNIRDEIQHRALELPLDKSEEIRLFYPNLRELYTKMFPEDSYFSHLYE